MKGYKNLTKLCQQFRRDIGKTQTDVAMEVGCGLSNISAFERGLNDSMVIFCWYLKHGLPYVDIIRRLRDE